MCYPLHGAFEFGFNFDVCYDCLCFKGLEDYNRSPSTYEVIMIDDRVVSRCAIHGQRAEIWYH